VSVGRGGSDRSHPTSQGGGQESGEAPDETADRSEDAKESRLARLRRTLLPASGEDAGTENPPAVSGEEQKQEAPFPEGRAPSPSQPLFSLDPPEDEKKPSRADDLVFRAKTRFRALGYWLREKGQIAWRGLRRGGAASAAGARSAWDWWSQRSRGTKIQAGVIGFLVLLYLIIKFLPAPGVPCQVSAAKECAPSNDTIAYVPRDAVIYVHLTVNSDSHQWDLEQDLAKELPSFTALLQSDTRALTGPAGKPINLSQQVLPWAKDDLALLGVPAPNGATPETYVVGVRDSDKANQFLATLTGGAAPAVKHEMGGVSVAVSAEGVATARDGDELLFGDVAAVDAALAAKAGQVPRLDGSDQDRSREQLPDVRFAEVYLSRAGVQRFLPPNATGASQLDTFVDYGATSGMAAGARARDDGIQVNLVSDLDPALEQRSPTVFASLPEFEPGLADEAGPRALGYIGVGELGPAINKALETAGASAEGLAGSLRALAQSLQKQAGVDPLSDLLPALGGQAALVAEPTGATPYVSLIVDDVDEEKADDALAALQAPLLRALSAGGQVPTFRTTDVDGVSVHSVRISPTVDLSYGIFDGKLVISTQPQGVSQVRSSGDNLAATSAFQDATDRLPDRLSALVFLNLDEVLGLAQRAGLAENPLYASLSEDISRIGSLGLAVRGGEDELQSELFLAIHD
jgi:hypothetical protein